MRRRASITGILATLTVLGGLAAATPAYAAHVACGQTITTNTVLDSDVGPCANNGIVIGANNITLNLNGFRVFGTPNPGDKAGILLQGRTGVTVTGPGSVTDFDGGVVIEGGGGNTVRQVLAQNNLGGSGTLYGDGIAIESSVNNLITGNSARNNGGFSGIGLYSAVDTDHPRNANNVSTGNVIDSNVVVGNSAPRTPTSSPSSTDNDGIRVEPNTTGNTITRNYVADSGLDGISLFRASGNNIVRGNSVVHNGFFRTTARRGDGIIVFNLADNNIIEMNVVRNNADNGIRIRPALGTTPGSSNNQVRNNYAVNNAALPTIPSTPFGSQAFDLNDQNPNCDNNVWFGNRYRTASPPCTTTGGVRLP